MGHVRYNNLFCSHPRKSHNRQYSITISSSYNWSTTLQVTGAGTPFVEPKAPSKIVSVSPQTWNVGQRQTLLGGCWHIVYFRQWWQVTNYCRCIIYFAARHSIHVDLRKEEAEKMKGLLGPKLWFFSFTVALGVSGFCAFSFVFGNYYAGKQCDGVVMYIVVHTYNGRLPWAYSVRRFSYVVAQLLIDGRSMYNS